jgi:hypothetical protein
MTQGKYLRSQRYLTLSHSFLSREVTDIVWCSPRGCSVVSAEMDAVSCDFCHDADAVALVYWTVDRTENFISD